MKQKSSESWNGGGWMVVTQEFQQEQLFCFAIYQSFLPCNVPNSPAQGFHAQASLLRTPHR
jgi:hypothetical protein